jgi:hypothetical protein
LIYFSITVIEFYNSLTFEETNMHYIFLQRWSICHVLESSLHTFLRCEPTYYLGSIKKLVIKIDFRLVVKHTTTL